MNLLLQPTHWFIVSNFIYVMIIYIVCMVIYIYTDLCKNLRNIINYFILNINDSYISHRKYINILFISFYMILIFNILGFLGLPLIMSSPYITITFSVCLCLYAIIMGIYKQGIKHFILKFAPHGLPKLLVPFMISIELLLLLFKPFIFGFRICLINTISHMILHIFEDILINIGKFSIFGQVTSIGQSVLFLFLIIDIIKAFIQAYLFTLSMSMYLKLCTEDH